MRLIQFRRIEGNPSLAGYAKVAFASGLVIGSIPIFKSNEGLTAGVSNNGSCSTPTAAS